MIYLLKIEEDGHFHGGPPPKPWAAEITGACQRYGLARTFIRALRDYRDARSAWSGNVYGVVARYPLHDGKLYEVSRCRGKPSKRYVARQFYTVAGGKMHERTPEEALAMAEGLDQPARATEPAILHRIREADDHPWVAEVTGLGTPRRLGFVLVDGDRLYRLREGHLYEAREVDTKGEERRRMVRVTDGAAERVTQAEALAWLAR